MNSTLRNVLLAVGLMVLVLAAHPMAMTPLEELGELLYFDQMLSEPDGQSCADCHLPSAFFVDPDSEFPVSQGVLPQNRWGNRNSPMSAYAFLSPDFHYDPVEGLYVGGQFWDGRAANVEEQAKGPFLNPLEMNNPNKRAVIEDILDGQYADFFIEVFGHDAKYIRHNIDEAYDFVANAIGAFERTDMFAPFNSKYDYYLQGNDVLTEQELRGLALFEGKAMCNACHPSEPGEGGEPPLFTDFTYDNLGAPKNPENPFYTLTPRFNPDGYDWVDYGLGGVLGLPEEMGKHKVMTLRNIAMTGPYLHNGVFSTLREVVEFYNARDVMNFPPPEVPMNVNTDELGDLGLTSDEIDDLVAFLETLTDGYFPAPGPAGRIAANTPRDFILAANYPNPFNPTTTIEYTIPSQTQVTIDVFNVLGQKVKTLVNETQPAGTYQTEWNGTDEASQTVATGVYFYRLSAGDVTMTKKMVMVK
ncbi:MAG TPA: T9SS type A sorting domain-containing protein [candidate division Zixibacteria bacterium]|nr:T9SS type A sorting domain-containing protein [candidate division Zixibacteria bacterium]